MAERNPGHFLKEWRQSMKMNQKEFAQHVGLSTSNYNSLEAGKVGYTQTSLETIASVLEVTPAELISMDPSAPQVERERDEWDDFYDIYQELSSDEQQMIKQIASMFRAQKHKRILARMRLSRNDSETA